MNTSVIAFIFFIQLLKSVSPQPSNITVSPSTFPSQNVTAIHDLEDPVYCSLFTWNPGWISVATNAFSSSSACCGRRVQGWKLHDNIQKDLKDNPMASPYCFYTKRLGSELVMKTLVGT